MSKTSERFGYQWDKYNWLDPLFKDQMLNWIGPLHPDDFEGKRVLDVACGVGYGSKILAESKAKKVYGVDNSKAAVDYARKFYPHKNVKYVCADATKVPLKDKMVDVCVSFETLEHIKNYQAFVSEIKRVLVNNGVLIISTPNKLLGTESDNPFHYKEFDQKEFTELLNKHFNGPIMLAKKIGTYRWHNNRNCISSVNPAIIDREMFKEKMKTAPHPIMILGGLFVNDLGGIRVSDLIKIKFVDDGKYSWLDLKDGKCYIKKEMTKNCRDRDFELPIKALLFLRKNVSGDWLLRKKNMI